MVSQSLFDRPLLFFLTVLLGSSLASAKTAEEALKEVEALPVQICKPYTPDSLIDATKQYSAWIDQRVPRNEHEDILADAKFKHASKEMAKLGLTTNPDQDIPEWIQTMLGDELESYYFESSKGKIHYLKGGSGPKVLVFFHGNPTWSFIWRKIIAQLDPAEYTFIAPDLLNLGFSESLLKPNNPDATEDDQFNMKNVSTAMGEFVKYIDTNMGLTPNPDVTLVVQDWGGPMGFSTAVQHPDVYKRIVVLNTGVGIPKELPDFQRKAHSEAATFVQKIDVPKPVAKVFGTIAEKGSQFSDKAEALKGVDTPFVTRLGKVQYDQQSISGIVSRAYEFPARLTENLDMAVHFARMVPAETIPETEEFPYRDLAINSKPLFNQNSAFLKKFKGPVQVIWGVKDPVLGAELEKTVVGILPNATYTKVEAGHFLQEECPHEIADVIKSIQKQ